MAKWKVNVMKKNRKTGVRIRAMLLLLICMLTIPYGTAFAEEADPEPDPDPTTVAITISHSFEVLNGYTPSAGTEFRYKIYAADPESPTPDGADEDGERTLAFSGVGTQQQTVEIQFDQAGTYQYTVEPVIAAQYENYNYDKTKYTVNVYVQENGGTLEPVVVIYKAGDTSQKLDGIVYKNSYSRPVSSSGGGRKHHHSDNSETTTASLLPQTDTSFSLLNPQTGDATNILLWLILVVISLTAILAFF